MKLLKYLIALILALFGIASPWEDIDVSDLMKTEETAVVTETDVAVFEDTEDERLVEETVAAVEAAVETAASSGVNIDPSLITSNVISFTTTDLVGNTVTSDIFGNYDLTLVHIWGTYCGPCLREIGSYGDLYRELPENVNMIGLVCDVYDGQDGNVEYAKQILTDNNVTFQNLRISTELYDVLYSIDYVPSSFFVDRDGHLIGQMLDGVGYESTVEVLNGYLR